MSHSPYQHASQPTLERYASGELADPELAVVEEHLLICETCRQMVAELDVFTPILRGANRKRAVFAHETEDGLIRLALWPLPDSKWAARFWGEKLEGSAVFSSPAGAYAHLRRVFSEMYPEHLCVPGCAPTEE